MWGIIMKYIEGFSVSPDVWLGLQMDYELRLAQRTVWPRVEPRVPVYLSFPRASVGTWGGRASVSFLQRLHRIPTPARGNESISKIFWCL